MEKESVKKFDLEAAFKALDEIEIPQTKGIKANRVDLKERFGHKPATETLVEDYYDVSSTEDLEDAKEERDGEIAKAKLARIEKIVDLNAETPEDLLPSYVGKVIMQCPQCMTLFYKNQEDIEPSDENPDVVNLNEPCQHCGNTSGYTLIGKVGAVTEDEADKYDETPAEENELDLDFDKGTEEVDAEGTGEGAEEMSDEEQEEESSDEASSDEDLDLDLKLDEVPEEEPEEEKKEESLKESKVEDNTDDDSTATTIYHLFLDGKEVYKSESIPLNKALSEITTYIKKLTPEQKKSFSLSWEFDESGYYNKPIYDNEGNIVGSRTDWKDISGDTIVGVFSEAECKEYGYAFPEDRFVVNVDYAGDAIRKALDANVTANLKEGKSKVKESKTTKQRLTVIEPGYQYKDKNGNIYTLYGDELEEDDTGIVYDWEFVNDENGDIYLKEEMAEESLKESKATKQRLTVVEPGYQYKDEDGNLYTLYGDELEEDDTGITYNWEFVDDENGDIYLKEEMAEESLNLSKEASENESEHKSENLTLNEEIDKDLDEKLKAHNDYIAYLQQMIKQEEEALKKAENDEIKAAIQRRLDAFTADLEAALPDAVKAEAHVEEAEETVEPATDEDKNEEKLENLALNESVESEIDSIIASWGVNESLKEYWWEDNDPMNWSDKEPLVYSCYYNSELLGYLEYPYMGQEEYPTTIKADIIKHFELPEGYNPKEISWRYVENDSLDETKPLVQVNESLTEEGDLDRLLDSDEFKTPVSEEEIDAARREVAKESLKEEKEDESDDDSTLPTIYNLFLDGKLVYESKSIPLDKALSEITAYIKKLTPEQKKSFSLSWEIDDSGYYNTPIYDNEGNIVGSRNDWEDISGDVIVGVFSEAECKEYGYPFPEDRFVVNVDYAGDAIRKAFDADGAANLKEEDESDDEEDEEEIEEPEFNEDDIDELDEDSLNKHIDEYLKEVYSNVKSYETTGCELKEGKLFVEGKISFNSGKEKLTMFEFLPAYCEGSLFFEGYNKDFSKDKAFTLNCSINESKTLITESFGYKYKINENLVKGLK